MIDLSQYFIEQFTEVCAAQNIISNQSLMVLCIYKLPSGNFGEFTVKLFLILKFLYKPKGEFIIYGDFNINILTDSSSAQQLNLL